MTIATGAAMFFLIWWVTLFAVLPWGVHDHDRGSDLTPGTDPGAPALPRLGRKLLWTTILASLIFAACYVVFAYRLITLKGVLSLYGIH
jgi:predicted secreted protein